MPVVPLVVLSLSLVLGPGTHAEHHTLTPQHEGVAPLLESGRGTVISTALLCEKIIYDTKTLNQEARQKNLWSYRIIEKKKTL